MFELNNETFTLEELQKFALENNIDFDIYMANMKKAGMVEIPDPNKIWEKPKDDEQAISSVKNIRKSIDENSPKVIGAIAKEYFNLDNFEAFRKDPEKSPGNWKRKMPVGTSKLRGTPFHPLARLQEAYKGGFYNNTEDEDLKRFFESTTNKGDFTKYEQYKEYQALIAEGKTSSEAFNLDWVDESTKLNAVKYRQRQESQQYIMNIDDDDIRESAEIAAETEKLEIFEENEDYLVYKLSLIHI